MPTHEMAFGLKEQVPEDAKVAWGARLIIEESYAYKSYINNGCKGRRPKQFVIDFVWNRQSFMGEDEDIQVFKKALNKGGKRKSAIVLAVKEIERLFNNYEWERRCGSPRAAGPKVVFKDERLMIVADPKASGGYVYVCAFPNKSAEEPAA